MTIPYANRRRVSPLLTLVVGLAFGLAITSLQKTPRLQAQGGDRVDESILTTGPTFTRYNEGTKVQVAHDAIYFLDYQAGKLFATVPTIPVVTPGAAKKFIGSFQERDLVADFKLKPGTHPKFLMTTSSTWYGSSQTYGDGGSMLVVFETTTCQVAVYKAEQTNYGPTSQAKLELVQVVPYRRPASDNN